MRTEREESSQVKVTENIFNKIKENLPNPKKQVPIKVKEACKITEKKFPMTHNKQNNVHVREF